MKNNNNGKWSLRPIVFVISAAFVVVSLLSLIYFKKYPTTSIVQCIISLIALVFSLVYFINRKKVMSRFARKLIAQQNIRSEFFESMTMPIAIFDEKNNIIWYNDYFRTRILKGRDVFGDDGKLFINSKAREALEVNGEYHIEFEGRIFTGFSGGFVSGKEDYTVVYFIDETEISKIEEEYKNSIPMVAIIAMDNIDEITSGMPESEQALARSTVEHEIENWAVSLDGLLRKVSGSRYILISNEKGFIEAKNTKFSILDRVRSLKLCSKGGTTLSIGVGHGSVDIRECEQMAVQALDMALGRGGDQAAVKTADGYEFFGGVKAIGGERRTKVRARVVSSAIKELILGSENVVIMGHRFPDFDCIGAAYALYGISNSMGRPCTILIDKEKNLAKPLVNKIIEKSGNIFSTPQEVIGKISKRTLLIIVDVHRAEFVEFPEIYNACDSVVVIDHHRRTVDYIKDAVVFYHEPYASSASEMVAELTQYLDTSITPSEANAMMAGIMLDTRNFVLRTGARTFSATAYLREAGADPVEVKSYFNESMDVYLERNRIVSSTEIYRRCAIAVNDHDNRDSRIASAQAADELLGIENVDASFVLFQIGSTVNISARSMGHINVQVIMESLGGGGHFTMAAAQLENTSLPDAHIMLTQAIDKAIQ